VGCVGVFGQVRERERDAAKEGKKTFFSLPSMRLGEEEDV
jgi:hypothetical protein